MAFDRKRQQAILFGGRCEPCYGYLQDTWLWDGQDWHEQQVAGPSAHFYGVMEYDKLTGR